MTGDYDKAYAAGYEMGLLDESLRVLVLVNANGPIHKTIRESNQEQAALIAKRHGFVAEFAPSAEGWLAVILSPQRSEVPDESHICAGCGRRVWDDCCGVPV